MKVLFISKYYFPHIGGVEKHISNICKYLSQDNQISIVTSKHESHNKLANYEVINGVIVHRFAYPEKRFLGLLSIWLRMLSFARLFITQDIIHIHDVFIWYLPIKILLFWKPVYLTMHGWEGKYPVPSKNILMRKAYVLLSKKTISVGKYIEKYYGVKPTKVIYGGVDMNNIIFRKKKNKKRIVFVGRMEKDTGLSVFLRSMKYLKDYDIEFCGDGPLASKCKKIGIVHGSVDPHTYMQKASICFSSGYLTILESLANKCVTIFIYNNELRKDMIQTSPLKKFIFAAHNYKEVLKIIKDYNSRRGNYSKIIKDGHEFAKKQTWTKIAKTYEETWN